MKRILIQSLTDWKNSPIRQPLLLRGARQTGKTYLVRQFAKNHFDKLFEVNFEKEKHYIDCFASLDPKKIIQELELTANQSIICGKTLLFLDEIQDCPNAIQALRFFYEEMPDLHVIGAGSLLEFALSADNFSMPVGRVSYLYLYPMTFSEMLMALEKNKIAEYLNNLTPNNRIPLSVHNQLLELIQLYFVLGGMPHVINLYAQHEKLLYCRQTQSAILNNYRDDFGKYATHVQQRYCERVFSKSFELIAKHFKFKDIDPEMDYRSLKQAIQLLFKANILTPIYYSKATGLPLSATQVEKKYKLLFLDVGLVQAAGRIPPEITLKENIMQMNSGALTEQYTGQHLLTLQPNYDRAELFYWQRDARGSQAEVDFILPVDNYLVPIEVKSGKTGRLKSLHMYMEKNKSKFGIKLSTDRFDTSEKVWSIPLYLVEQIPRLIRTAKVSKPIR